MQSRARPRGPGDAPVCSLIAGIRTAHPAKSTPPRAKNSVTATRSLTNAEAASGLPGRADANDGLVICDMKSPKVEGPGDGREMRCRTCRLDRSDGRGC